MKKAPNLRVFEHANRAVAKRRQKQKTPDQMAGVFMFKAWQCPTLTWGDPTLPSALSVFTSEFEMDSGGSHLLLPPGIPVWKLVSDTNFQKTKKFGLSGNQGQTLRVCPFSQTCSDEIRMNTRFKKRLPSLEVI
jgi:hypothetical protein